MDEHSVELKEKGYTIVSGLFTPEKVAKARQLFFDWLKTVPHVEAYHEREAFQGIMKFAQIGHQKHAWFIKTDPAVQQVFKDVWSTDELVTGFDGCCWIPEHWSMPDVCWTHTDQSAAAKGRHCVQGFVSLTNNVDRSFVVYEGTHLLHEKYMKMKGFTGTRNWRLIDPVYLASLESRRKVLKVNAGDLVLWDSRTFHQNQYGSPEERLVQYVCFLPRHHPSNTPGMQRTRHKYFEKRRTTSHWPYPLSVVAQNPELNSPPVDLSEYEEEIKKLL